METQGTEGGKVTNLDYLLKLSKGNEQFVKDMIRIFLEENPLEIGALEKAVNDRNFQQIGATAHKLRSTVPFVGIDKVISEEISELETLAKVKAGDPMIPETKEDTGAMLSDKELTARIDGLFNRIKGVCAAAYQGLGGYRTA